MRLFGVRIGVKGISTIGLQVGQLRRRKDEGVQAASVHGHGDRVNARRVVLPHRRQERLADTGAVEQRPPLLSEIRGLM
jgi:hypothetical protein